MAGTLKTRIIIDILMTLGLIFQMGYMIVGDLAHEFTGVITISLWVIHNILHYRWYATLGINQYPPKRIIQTALNLLLLISVLGIAVSSVILSSYVFSFLGIETGMGFARSLHMISVYWSFVLSSLHLGLHWSRIIKIIIKHTIAKPSKIRTTVLRITALTLSCFGIYSFIKQQILSYLFLRTMFVFFDFEQSILSFFFEYVSMMILFVTVSYYIMKFLTKRHWAKRKAKEK